MEIKGIVKSVSGPREFQNVMQIGFTLKESPDKWYNVAEDEEILEGYKENILKNGSEISFDYDEKTKAVTKLVLIKAAEVSESSMVVNIKGKDFVTYAGLLKMAHEKGLQNFEILEQFVSPDMKIAWVKVRAHFEDEVFFDGIGSSTPENTGEMTQFHPIEMSHTRAKGRALRDFLNIGTAMLEELKQG